MISQLKDRKAQWVRTSSEVPTPQPEHSMGAARSVLSTRGPQGSPCSASAPEHPSLGPQCPCITPTPGVSGRLGPSHWVPATEAGGGESMLPGIASLCAEMESSGAGGGGLQDRVSELRAAELCA